MKTAWTCTTLVPALVAFATAAPAAHAHPRTLTISDQDISPAFARLAPELSEPVGLRATTDVAALGLRRGDLVRAINGQPASNGRRLPRALFDVHTRPTVLYLDVIRHGHPLVVRVEVTLGPVVRHMKRHGFATALPLMIATLEPVRSRGGAISGFLTKWAWWAEGRLADGDVLRAIDGVPITSVAAARAALDAARTHPRVVLSIDRAGRRFNLTLVLDDAAGPDPHATKLVAGIVRVDKTTYRVPRALRDLFLRRPSAFAHSARLVPAIANGKPDGFKIYAIRPGSVFAALGLKNGDRLDRIAGHTLTSIDSLMAVHATLRRARRIELHLIRRGRSRVLVYLIR